MLILSRKIGEAVVIGNNITIRLLETKGGTIKLGVEAPDDIAIHREEIYLRILEENKKAAQEAQLADISSLSSLIQDKKSTNND